MKVSARMGASCAILIAVLAGPCAAADSSPAASTPDGYVRQLAGLINDYRERHGLGPLVFVGELATLAGEHSESMSERRRLSHEGFMARFHRASSKVCVENVGWNFRTPEGLFKGWRDSPEHHRNLLEPKVERMGIAVDERYVTFFACR